MTAASRLMVLGLAFILGGAALFAWVDWPSLWLAHPEYVPPLSRAVYAALRASALWALVVPGLLLAVSGLRFATARGGRGLIAWKLFAFFTLWAILSFALFFGLFLAYASGTPQPLLLPALAGCFGYILLGLGFVASTLERG